MIWTLTAKIIEKEKVLINGLSINAILLEIKGESTQENGFKTSSWHQEGVKFTEHLIIESKSKIIVGMERKWHSRTSKSPPKLQRLTLKKINYSDGSTIDWDTLISTQKRLWRKAETEREQQEEEKKKNRQAQLELKNSKERERQRFIKNIKQVQEGLAILGFYEGKITGESNLGTISSIQDWQVKEGLPITDTITIDLAIKIKKQAIALIAKRKKQKRIEEERKKHKIIAKQKREYEKQRKAELAKKIEKEKQLKKYINLKKEAKLFLRDVQLFIESSKKTPQLLKLMRKFLQGRHILKENTQEAIHNYGKLVSFVQKDKEFIKFRNSQEEKRLANRQRKAKTIKTLLQKASLFLFDFVSINITSKYSDRVLDYIDILDEQKKETSLDKLQKYKREFNSFLGSVNLVKEFSDWQVKPTQEQL